LGADVFGHVDSFVQGMSVARSESFISGRQQLSPTAGKRLQLPSGACNSRQLVMVLTSMP